MNEIDTNSLPVPIDLWQSLLTYVGGPWFTYQLVAICVTFVVTWLLARPVSALFEARARRIKGNPRLLRLSVALLHRVHSILFMLSLGFILIVLLNITWPSRSYLIYTLFQLTLAWVVMSVLSKVIRSRTISRVVAFGGWTYAALYILGISNNATVFLDSIGFDLGNAKITLLLLIKVTVVLSMTLWFAITAGSYFESRIRHSEELTPSIRVLIGKMLKITLVILALVISLSGLGIDLTAFTVFSGAVGVGVGFGLQKVVSNFISGIIILLDRSIKPGDTISLGDTFGWIRELSTRFVSVITRDGREHLIPNEDFITTPVINWSFSNELVRLDVHFGVSYDSDPNEISALAIAAAATVPRVLPSNTPVCWMTGFGDSSIDFILRFWISDPQNGLTNIRGKVLLAMWNTFKENGVNIPYPHREIIMRTPVKLEQSNEKGGDTG